MKFNKIMLVATLALGISCGTEDDEEAKSELEGTWTALKCHTEDDTSYKESYKFTGSSFEAMNYGFSDAACATPSFDVLLEGTYTVPGSAEAPDGALNMNLTIVKITLSPKTDALAKALNDSKLYGKTDFAANTKTDITGLESSTGKGDATKSGTVAYDIYKNENGFICFGEESETKTGKTEDLRPITLETGDSCFKK